MSDPTLAFRCPQNLRELLDSRASLSGSSVTAVILAALRDYLAQPIAAPEPGALEVAVSDLLDADGAGSSVDREAALILARIGDQASGVPSVTAVRELRALLDDATDAQGAEVAAFRRQLAQLTPPQDGAA